MNREYNCADCDEVIPDKRAAILRKDFEDRKPWSLSAEHWLCLACQAKRDEDGLDGRLIPTEAMATSAEGDDETRSRELGWGQLTNKRLVRVTA